MRNRADLEWVENVLYDVITFLAENELMRSAQMLAVAAAHIEHDMKKGNSPAFEVTREPTATNVVAFPARTRLPN